MDINQKIAARRAQRKTESSVEADVDISSTSGRPKETLEQRIAARKEERNKQDQEELKAWFKELVERDENSKAQWQALVTTPKYVWVGLIVMIIAGAALEYGYFEIMIPTLVVVYVYLFIRVRSIKRSNEGPKNESGASTLNDGVEAEPHDAIALKPKVPWYIQVLTGTLKTISLLVALVALLAFQNPTGAFAIFAVAAVIYGVALLLTKKFALRSTGDES